MHWSMKFNKPYFLHLFHIINRNRVGHYFYVFAICLFASSFPSNAQVEMENTQTKNFGYENFQDVRGDIRAETQWPFEVINPGLRGDIGRTVGPEHPDYQNLRVLRSQVREVARVNPLEGLVLNSDRCHKAYEVSATTIAPFEQEHSISGISKLKYSLSAVVKKIEHPRHSQFDYKTFDAFMGMRRNQRLLEIFTSAGRSNLTEDGKGYVLMDKMAYFSRPCEEMYLVNMAPLYSLDIEFQVDFPDLAPALESEIRRRERSPGNCPSGVSLVSLPALGRAEIGNTVLRGKDHYRLMSSASELRYPDAVGYGLKIEVSRYLCKVESEDVCQGLFCASKRKEYFAKRELETRKVLNINFVGSVENGDIQIFLHDKPQKLFDQPLPTLLAKYVDPTFRTDYTSVSVNRNLLHLRADYSMSRKMSKGVALLLERRLIRFVSQIGKNGEEK